jgi:predicted permease
MKKIGLVLLFVFIPILLFKLFLNIDFRAGEFDFAILALGVMAFLYLIAYLFARRQAPRFTDDDSERLHFLKTTIVNQGRSAAFFGSAILAIEELRIPAAIYITLLGIYLFAIVPYILAHLHGREAAACETKNPLPRFLRVFPWYLAAFPISATVIHMQTGVTTGTYEWGVLLEFAAAVTIPAALYYVGSGIRLADVTPDKLRQLFFGHEGELAKVRVLLLLTMVITPVVIAALFGSLWMLGLLPAAWFAVLLLNAVLPITSTNMFLVPYGINKKVTALSVTWSTLFSLPLFVVLLYVLSRVFG